MGPNPLTGLIFLWIGGFASATNFVPFRGIRRWSWEIYWLLQSFVAWILAPLILAHIIVPDLSGVLHEAYSANPAALQHALLFGALGGVGLLAFGYAIRFLGITLGYAIAMALYGAVGALAPLFVHRPPGAIMLAGFVVFLAGLALTIAAGVRKDRELTYDVKLEAGESDFDFRKGIAVTFLAVVMSGFYLFGIVSAKPLRLVAAAHLSAAGKPEHWQYLPALLVVLFGAFLTNLVWSLGVVIKKRSGGQFFGTPGVNPMRASHVTGNTMADFDPEDPQYSERLSVSVLAANYALAALAGVLGYLHVLLNFLGGTRAGRFQALSGAMYVGWIIVFASLWGLAFQEWQGTSRRTRTLAAAGILVLLAATIITGYGTYIASLSK